MMRSPAAYVAVIEVGRKPIDLVCRQFAQDVHLSQWQLGIGVERERVGLRNE